MICHKMPSYYCHIIAILLVKMVILLNLWEKSPSISFTVFTDLNFFKLNHNKQSAVEIDGWIVQVQAQELV